MINLRETEQGHNATVINTPMLDRENVRNLMIAPAPGLLGRATPEATDVDGYEEETAEEAIVSWIGRSLVYEIWEVGREADAPGWTSGPRRVEYWDQVSSRSPVVLLESREEGLFPVVDADMLSLEGRVTEVVISNLTELGVIF